MLRHPLHYLFCIVLLLGSLSVSAQKSVRVSGTILQPDKSTPIPGASIQRVGYTTGVVTDEAGAFLIDIQTQDTLLIRAIGYKSILYLPRNLPVSELRVTIVMQEDSVMLGEVEVTNRPSQEMIERAIRNMKRPDPNFVKNPSYKPPVDIPPPPPAAAPSIDSPISMLYEMFSKEGKERAKLQEMLMQLEMERIFREAQKEREEYNKLFKDNTGFQ
ncbi:carboxypeptidase-like regulatory domain-containing protein [Pontibacter beigongshangensis]|uniref:carboxypeptidase-like regulatory domain-containing protein n=1 Tax=Pontibacter beigongshangensis TaxID=2574733 RepID=UPI0016509B7A|nr:carboxypeptidase-like regulatory domain-containing protein [Pontibacter beigongshangensis]